MHKHREPHGTWAVVASTWNIALALGLLAVLMAPLFSP